MARTKLRKFAELKTFPELLEKPVGMAGTWHAHFGNGAPITLELGCGEGDYTITLAQQSPDKNFIGMDIQGERLWSAVKATQALGLKNVRWLRAYINHLLEYFTTEEISTIWITFPDPQPRDGKAGKRLTSPKFLELYRRIIKPNGQLTLKTDDTNLFEYSIETVTASGGIIIDQLRDIHNTNQATGDLAITTPFERRWLKLGKSVHVLRWHWPTTKLPLPPRP